MGTRRAIGQWGPGERPVIRQARDERPDLETDQFATSENDSDVTPLSHSCSVTAVVVVTELLEVAYTSFDPAYDIWCLKETVHLQKNVKQIIFK